MSKRRRINPIDEARKFINQNKDPPDFFVDRFEKKGRGIRTSKFRQRGDFLLQYAVLMQLERALDLGDL
ncbi:uncharacterized protein LOC144623821 [Crassostrea virginica]